MTTIPPNWDSSSEPELSECFREAAAALDAVGIEWALIGALAAVRAVDHVITAEDVVVHKLIAWRPRDQDDVASILANADVTLDEAYIEHWAGEWDVTDRWREARRTP